MKLSGLSNQHVTLEGLLERFPETHERDGVNLLVPTNGRLLRQLLTMEGPDLWVGSSMSLMNFVARNTTHDDDWIPPLAYAAAVGGHYQIKYRPPRELNMPPDAMVCFWEDGVDQAARRLLQVIDLSDGNPNRITASWFWYVCPKRKCSYHHPNFHQNCVRCHHRFPDERKCQEIGIYRRPRFPKAQLHRTIRLTEAVDRHLPDGIFTSHRSYSAQAVLVLHSYSMHCGHASSTITITA